MTSTDDEHLSFDLAQQDTQERHDRLPVVAVLAHLEKQPSIQRDGADR
jgi:hypothetical protein